MFNELINKISELNVNVNEDNIVLILIIATLAIVAGVKIYTKLKEVVVKAFRVISIVIVIALVVAVQQGTFEQWMTKLTAYIK